MRVDATLRLIILGFRLVTAVWITVVGSIAIVSWDASPAVVLGAVALVWVWSGFTVLVWRAGRLSTLPWLLADLVVAVLVALSPALDGSDQGSFVGGYPMSSVLLWGYSYRIPGGLGAALVMSSALIVTGDYDLAGSTALAILFLAVGGVAAWAFGVLRTSESRRLQAEAELEQERSIRIRSEERAEMAAHLHDSVLQTLALIQKRSTNPAEIRRLAQAQERDLRSWLFGPVEPVQSLAAALDSACSELAERLGVEVEFVHVGDLRIDDHLNALVGATHEAIMNAAKHAEADKVSVFADVGGEAVRVFVRDRGVGFDPGAVDPGRRGIAESVVGRMKRHGGSVTLISSPGSGTEVRLTMPLRKEGTDG